MLYDLRAELLRHLYLRIAKVGLSGSCGGALYTGVWG